MSKRNRKTKKFVSRSFGHREPIAIEMHDCSFCDDVIHAGELYERWLERHGRRLRVVKRHWVCPEMLEEADRWHREQEQERVAIVFEVKLVNRIAILANGDLVTEAVIVTEPKEMNEAELEELDGPCDLDDEVPF